MGLFSFKPDLFKNLQREEKFDENVNVLMEEKRKLLGKAMDFERHEEMLRREITNLHHASADKSTDRAKRVQIEQRIAQLEKEFSDEAETERKLTSKALTDLNTVVKILQKQKRIEKDVLEQLAA